MGRIAAVFRVLLTFVFMVSVFTPFAAVQTLAQTTTDTEETASTAAEAPQTGTLQIWLTAGDTGG
jgi:hypothetical protein